MEISNYVILCHKIPRKRRRDLQITPRSVACGPYETRFDMPSTREELLAALDELDERLGEIAEEIDDLSSDGKRLSDELECIRDTLLALNNKY